MVAYPGAPGSTCDPLESYTVTPGWLSSVKEKTRLIVPSVAGFGVNSNPHILSFSSSDTGM